MRWSLLPFLLASVSFAAARSRQHVGKSPKEASRIQRSISRVDSATPLERRASPYLNAHSKKFVVNGKKLPDVHFDIGESYAGLLPISKDPKETKQLYFWFFPTQNPKGVDEITIWLNGGPGCSSLEGLLQENGPFLWQYGTFAPVPNPYSWTNLTNMVWVEQPVGTGFSQGEVTAKNEHDVAQQFLGFFKNFVHTFALQGKKVYITGESYAGMYIPYISHAMLERNDTENFNLESIMMYDPLISSNLIQEEIPARAFVEYWDNLLALDAPSMAHIRNKSRTCGYDTYMAENLVFPPNGPLPPADDDNLQPGCDIWNYVFTAAIAINPCFDEYQIATTCPVLWDVLGFPGSFDYTPVGATVYFNRSDVQSAINAPPTNWAECFNGNVFAQGNDNSSPSARTVLPGVIERTKKTIIGQGMLDMIIMTNGTLLAIQNMTWSGKQGFQRKPLAKFYVPPHQNHDPATLAGSGIMGKTHTERGLTFVEINLSGHMVPQYAPSAAYRMMQFMLGRIDNLTS